MLKKAKHLENKRCYAVKVINKHKTVKTKQVDHVLNEITLQSQFKHSFFLSVKGFSQDSKNIYIFTDFIEFGDLANYLKKVGRLEKDKAAFYSGILLIAIYKLHLQKVVYRDIKPENLMLTRSGYLKLADFGFAKIVLDKTYTLCGTPEYMAPEVILGKGHDRGCDYWSLGIFVYDMIAGVDPFGVVSPIDTYKNILNTKMRFYKEFDKQARSLCKKLCNKESSLRLGMQRRGVKDLMDHPFFESISWKDLAKKEMTPPYLPPMVSFFN